jgi:ornithine carbamoyltransferase
MGGAICESHTRPIPAPIPFDGRTAFCRSISDPIEHSTRMPPFRPRLSLPLRRLAPRLYNTNSTAPPPHLLTIADLTRAELAALVLGAHAHKSAARASATGPLLPAPQLRAALSGRQVALLFSKRSTRTRVSTEGAVAALGGHALFLGRDDIQLGVNESARDTAEVLGRMCAGLVARVGAHAEAEELARWAGVPVVNALSDRFHPMQAVADLLTLREAFPAEAVEDGLGLEGRKVAWCGDPSNVFVDLAIGALKMGADVAVAAPAAYALPRVTRDFIVAAARDAPQPGTLTESEAPEEAVKGADVLVTDTFVSMGQEAEAAEKLRAFEGYQVSSELARRGGAKEGWRFMHCMPRHLGEGAEVTDEVFYGPRSLVFDEAENRLWAAIAVLEAFMVNKGKIV